MVRTVQATESGSLSSKGKQLYETKLRKLLEPEHRGEYVAIEPGSGSYYLGHTMSEAYEKAIEVHPDKKFYLARVGYKAAVSFKHPTVSPEGLQISRSPKQLKKKSLKKLESFDSAPLKEFLQQLQAQYGEPMDLKELRRQLAKKLGNKSLSDLVREMREEEMH